MASKADEATAATATTTKTQETEKPTKVKVEEVDAEETKTAATASDSEKSSQVSLIFQDDSSVESVDLLIRLMQRRVVTTRRSYRTRSQSEIPRSKKSQRK